MGPLTQPRRKCVPIDILLLKQLYLIDKLPMRDSKVFWSLYNNYLSPSEGAFISQNAKEKS